MNRSHSLKNKKVFLELFQKQENKILSNCFVFLWHPRNDLKKMKIGIVISSKKYNAVKRNNMKRIVRSLIDEYMDLSIKCNLIIIIRKNIIEKDRGIIKEEFKNLSKNFLELLHDLHVK